MTDARYGYEGSGMKKMVRIDDRAIRAEKNSFDISMAIINILSKTNQKKKKLQKNHNKKRLKHD